MGSGLGTAYRMSTHAKDLHGCVLYLDGQKVTEGNSEVLIRASTYSPHERRMLEIASALIPSESKDCVREFFHLLKVQCAKGYKGEGILESIEGFDMNVFRCSADASGGIRAAWEESFPVRDDGRNKYVQCEFHFRQSEKRLEGKIDSLRSGIVDEHRKLVKQWLVSEGDAKEKAQENIRVSKHYIFLTEILLCVEKRILKRVV